jgi:glycosyltransferase involved in cell wall biosynthesis
MLAKRCSKVVVPSKCCAELISTIAPGDKVVTIPNGVDFRSGWSMEFNQVLPRSSGRVRIATIGQLVEWKRHVTAIEVASRVIARCPTADFLIVGDERMNAAGPTLDHLKRMIDERGLAGRVTVSGYMNEVSRVLPEIDILLHPAFPEPFGRIVVEAMACGCTVIACEGNHGPGEIIRNGIDGLLVPRSVEELSSAVVGMVNNPSRRAHIGREAHRRATAQFGQALMAQRIQNLYCSLVAGSDGRTRPPS